VPYQIYKAQTVKTAAEGGFPVARAELDWNGMDADTRTEFEKLYETEGDPITWILRHSSGGSRCRSATGPWFASTGMY